MSNWINFKKQPPKNDGAMIWWDDGERWPRLVPARDFCDEDKGHWMYPEPPMPFAHSAPLKP